MKLFWEGGQRWRACDCGTPYLSGTYSIHRDTGPHQRWRITKPRRKASERELEMARLLDGGLTLQQVGDKYGITRERVRQIYVRVTGHGKQDPRHGRSKQRIPENICAYCGATYTGFLVHQDDRYWQARTGFAQHAFAAHPEWKKNQSFVAVKEFPERDKKIKEWFERGMQYKEMAARLGTSVANISQTVNALGMRRYGYRRHGYAERREAVVKDLEAGMTRTELEKKYPGTAIYYIMRQYRGAMRNR